MTSPCKLVRIGSWWFCVAVLLVATRAIALAAEPTGKSHFQVNVELFSVEAGCEGQAADKYRYQGSGTAGPGGCLGLAVSLRNGTFAVNIVHKKKAGCHVEVTGDVCNTDRHSEPRTFDLDLSDLKPVGLRLEPEGSDGCTVIVNLAPSIRRVESPARLDRNSLGVTNWAFSGSSVIVDGWRYAGTMNMAGGKKAFVDVAGLAKVEFSLEPFRGAEPTGVLQSGTVTLTHEAEGVRQHTIEIHDVRTGRPVRIELGSRPWQVWARWTPPSHSLQDAVTQLLAHDPETGMADMEPEAAEREQIIESIRRVKEQLRGIDPADLSYSGPLARACRAISLTSGMGPIRESDRVE